MDFIYEQNLINHGYLHVCGIDEAGRGSLAGPLVAAAVIFSSENVDLFAAVKDSKLLTSKKREALCPLIMENAVCWALGVVTNGELDRHGLAFANKIALKRAWKNLAVKPDFILSDYMAKTYFETPFELVVKGDQKIMSVAAASILAKVFRDKMMVAFGNKYPEFGFEIHKGYGTQFHRDKINELGPCAIHRKTFGPVRAKLF